MISKNVAILVRNWVPEAVLSAAGSTPQKLIGPERGEGLRSLGLGVVDNTVSVTGLGGKPVSGIALGLENATPGTEVWVQLSSVAVSSRVRKAPAGVVNAAGITGGIVEILQDPEDGSDNDAIETTGAASFEVLINATAEAVVATGPLHSIRVRVEATTEARIGVEPQKPTGVGPGRREYVVGAGTETVLHYDFTATDFGVGIDTGGNLVVGIDADVSGVRFLAVDLYYSPGTQPEPEPATLWPEGALDAVGLTYPEAMQGRRVVAFWVRTTDTVPDPVAVEEVRVIVHDPNNPDGVVVSSTLQVGPALGLSIEDRGFDATTLQKISIAAVGTASQFSAPELRVETWRANVDNTDRDAVDVLVATARREPVAVMPLSTSFGARSMAFFALLAKPGFGHNDQSAGTVWAMTLKLTEVG